MRQLLTLISLLVSLCAFAQADVKVKIDSCYKVLKSQKGEQRLRTFVDMTNISLYSGMYYELSIINDFEKEALRQNNMEMLNLAKIRKLNCMYNHKRTDTLLIAADRELEECKTQGLTEAYYSIFNIKIEELTFGGQSLAALKSVQTVYNEAKKSGNDYGIAVTSSCLGLINQILENNTTSEKFFRESIQHFKKCSKPNYNALYDVYFRLLNQLQQQEKFDDMLKLAHEFEASIKKQEQQKNVSINIPGRYMLCYFEAALAYVGKKDANNVGRYLKKMEGSPMKGDYFKEMTETIRMYHFALIGKYDGAITIADSIILENKKHGQEVVCAVYLKDKARFLTKAGRYKEATAIYEEHTNMMSKLQTQATLDRQAEFTTFYELDKAQAEKKLYEVRLVYSLVAVFLLVGAVLIYTIYSYKLRNRNRYLCRKVEEYAACQHELLRIKAGEVAKQQEESTEVPLFDALEKIMHDERLFCDAGINRDTLAVRLGTNRTYLTESIKKGCGKNFNDYIADLRLTEAVKIMEDEPNVVLADISDRVGYSTYSTFFRAFAKRFGITPTDYIKFIRSEERTVAVEENEE